MVCNLLFAGIKAAEPALSPFPQSVTQSIFLAIAAGVSGAAVLARSAGVWIGVYVLSSWDEEEGCFANAPHIPFAKPDRSLPDPFVPFFRRLCKRCRRRNRQRRAIGECFCC